MLDVNIRVSQKIYNILVCTTLMAYISQDRISSNLASTFFFGLVSLFNGISTLFRSFNAEAILQEEQ